MMDLEKTKKSLDMLADAARTAPEPVRRAVEGSVDVARAAVAEVETMQADLAEAREVALQARPVVEALEQDLAEADERAAAYTRAEQAEAYRVKARKAIKKRAAETAELQQIANAIDALKASFDATLPDVVRTLVAMRTRIVNKRSGLNPLADTRVFGEWVVRNARGVTVAVCERRDSAIALVKRMLALEDRAARSKTTLTDLDVSKVGNGINVDVPEDHPARPTLGHGAPADRDSPRTKTRIR